MLISLGKWQTAKTSSVQDNQRRAQVSKFIFVVPQRKLSFSKAQLRSLCFKLLDAIFMTSFGTKL
jgi:ribosomal protein L32